MIDRAPSFLNETGQCSCHDRVRENIMCSHSFGCYHRTNTRQHFYFLLVEFIMYVSRIPQNFKCKLFIHKEKRKDKSKYEQCLNFVFCDTIHICVSLFFYLYICIMNLDLKFLGIVNMYLINSLFYFRKRKNEHFLELNGWEHMISGILSWHFV